MSPKRIYSISNLTSYEGGEKMIDTNALRGRIYEKGYSQSKVAKEIGITAKTFYNKMSIGVFGSDEIEKMIDLLDIDDPAKIFFAKNVT